MLCEKYRPKEFGDVIGLDSSIPKLSAQGKAMPHFLFYGPAGCGKTTTAYIIIKKLGAQSLILNASSERGINTIRDKVKSFAQTTSMNDKPKIVLLDEADYLTPEAQTALRNLMETYSANCKFVLTANYLNKIIAPIQSRCSKFEFKAMNPEAIYTYIRGISNLEKINIKDSAILKLVGLYRPDIRQILNKLQTLATLDKEITAEDITKTDLIVPQLWEHIKEGNFPKVRQLALDSSINYEGLLKQLFDYVMTLGIVKDEVILKIAECNRYLNNCIDNDVEFAKLLLELIRVVKE